jgi:hypothetical protein
MKENCKRTNFMASMRCTVASDDVAAIPLIPISFLVPLVTRPIVEIKFLNAYLP